MQQKFEVRFYKLVFLEILSNNKALFDKNTFNKVVWQVLIIKGGTVVTLINIFLHFWKTNVIHLVNIWFKQNEVSFAFIKLV